MCHFHRRMCQDVQHFLLHRFSLSKQFVFLILPLNFFSGLSAHRPITDLLLPQEKRLRKFQGRTTCPTFNLCSDYRAAKIVLDYPGIK
ncbi:unnamed protein product, partial [Adineta steineri]